MAERRLLKGGRLYAALAEGRILNFREFRMRR